MAPALKKRIQATPMAPYMGLMRDLDATDKQAVVAFLIDTMDGPSDRELFDGYLEDWQRDTRFLSSVTAITSSSGRSTPSSTRKSATASPSPKPASYGQPN